MEEHDQHLRIKSVTLSSQVLECTFVNLRFLTEQKNTYMDLSKMSRFVSRLVRKLGRISSDRYWLLNKLLNLIKFKLAAY